MKNNFDLAIINLILLASGIVLLSLAWGWQAVLGIASLFVYIKK